MKCDAEDANELLVAPIDADAMEGGVYSNKMLNLGRCCRREGRRADLLEASSLGSSWFISRAMAASMSRDFGTIGF